MRRVRCAIYTHKSTEGRLEQEFNSLDAQREACEAYITSHDHQNPVTSISNMASSAWYRPAGG